MLVGARTEATDRDDGIRRAGAYAAAGADAVMVKAASSLDIIRHLRKRVSRPIFSTKNGKSRAVHMSKTLYNLLSAKAGKLVSEYVFTLNGRKISDRWISHKFKYYVYDLRFNDDMLHFHGLRRTFASWLVQDGASLCEVQKLLGRSSSKVTEAYSHLRPEQLPATVNRIQMSLN